MSARALRDIQTVVEFLATREEKPDEDYRGKLKCVLKYLEGTQGLNLTLSIYNICMIKWWVEAWYTVHKDCNGHTGAMLSLGKGAVTTFSAKNNINGEILT